MGEVGYANTETTFLSLIYLTFIILTTLLLLNLLIAMMSGTYATDSSEQGKTMWWMLVPDTLSLPPLPIPLFFRLSLLCRSYRPSRLLTPHACSSIYQCSFVDSLAMLRWLQHAHTVLRYEKENENWYQWLRSIGASLKFSLMRGHDQVKCSLS
jgi:hypothetical protein